MGKKASEIIKVDVTELIDQLNKAFADEWLAYYQYWIGAKITKGIIRTAVISELTEHAQDELKHAEMLADRIIQLGGTPTTNPKDLKPNCAYLDPKDVKVDAILKQAIEGERCAIDVYTKLLKFTKDKDEITYNMVLDILDEELEHEEDFENLLEDLGCCSKK